MSANDDLMYGVNGGYTAVLESNYLIRAGGDFMLGGEFTKPNSTITYFGGSLRFGKINAISEKFFVAPYLGLGYVAGVSTSNRFSQEDLVDLANESQDLVDVEQRYESSGFGTLTVPIGVDFHIHTSGVGLVLGYFISVSDKTEYMGLRLGISFGQLGSMFSED